MFAITTIEALEAIYGRPQETSIVKETPFLTDEYRAIVEASPFATLATAGPEGLDCSPRGDEPGFVRVVDERTLALPDRRGNNRIDSLRNIVRDPRVALLFLVPGFGATLRVNGRATISVAPDLLASFAVEQKAPRSVTLISIDAVYFQCARAIMRSGLWNPSRHAAPGALPTPGDMLASISKGRIGGQAYDEAWPKKAADTLW
ncbi:pyridoxamine 5'-phosphate oxidase family protein [Methylopila sp. M107]|uniref:pyridoxamine 5'-phosphate oxidase family protein n=1 Tax=Methylopila sp. M107 TaxID=1101190 RepID=UPI0003668B4D|nr:pyridoxamine 5'-phosphate oxidase family protein [Methylopila sp. M107]